MGEGAFMIEEKSCGAVILRKNEDRFDYDVLLVKHTLGHWGFPKGHMEADETERETALREVKEETGYTVALENDYRGISSYLPKPGTHKTVVYFAGIAVDGEADCSEDDSIEKVEWFPYTEAQAYLAYPSDVVVLRDVRKYLARFEEDL